MRMLEIMGNKIQSELYSLSRSGVVKMAAAETDERNLGERNG
jgi:hypothetical protein